MNNSPFDHSYFLGYVNFVSPLFIKIHFPSSILMKTFFHYSEAFKGGLVGNYVTIEGEERGFLGRILEISLPEKERLELSERSFSTKTFHPVGKVEILSSFDLFKPYVVENGLSFLPLIGAKVFICASEFLSGYLKSIGVKPTQAPSTPIVKIGTLATDKNVPVHISLQAIFSRHCAVVGTTGGGKSYTISKLIEGIIESRGKAIILDPTGEYSTYDNHPQANHAVLITDSYFPFQNLTINDLFILFRPSGQVQQPVLLEAIKSLKVAFCLMNNKEANGFEGTAEKCTFTLKLKKVELIDGILVKRKNSIAAYNNACYKYKETVEDFSINYFAMPLLPKQIANEFYYPSNDTWSDRIDERNFGNSTSLIMRISNVVADRNYSGMFGFNNPSTTNLIELIDKFLLDENKNILRIGFEDVPYNFQAREILANALGKYLLNKARTQVFRDNPLVVFLDEAHQFLNKKVKDEYFESTELNAFDSIAKESRKYGLFLCLATQMPRDIPTGTLSQMGTFVTHRLINHLDKEAILSACSSANKETISFLPSLAAGEAIIMGVEFPMPIPVKITLPITLPKYDTPRFKTP